MIEHYQGGLDDVFHALCHPTRRKIVSLLSEKPFNIGELVPRFDVSLAAVSKHVQILEQAGIVEREVKGRIHTCRLNADALSDAYAWLGSYEKYWTSRLDALQKALEKDS